jgi:hypothetical protein
MTFVLKVKVGAHPIGSPLLPHWKTINARESPLTLVRNEGITAPSNFR